jgi:hypothetical protein
LEGRAVLTVLKAALAAARWLADVVDDFSGVRISLQRTLKQIQSLRQNFVRYGEWWQHSHGIRIAPAGQHNTLPMLIYSKVRLGVNPSVNALATILVLFVAIGVALSAWLMRRAEKRRDREMRLAESGH